MDDGFEARATAFASVAALAAFPVGYATWLVRVLGPELRRYLSAGTLVTSLAVPVGVICGAAGVALVSTGSRRRCMAISSAVYVAASCVAASATDVWLCWLGFYGSGVACGFGLPATLAYVAEIAPPRRRGTLVSSVELGVAVGAMAARALGFTLHLFRGPYAWRVLLLLGAVPSLLLLWAICVDDLLPRSPRAIAHAFFDARRRQKSDDPDDDDASRSSTKKKKKPRQEDDERTALRSQSSREEEAYNAAVRGAVEALGMPTQEAETTLAEIKTAPEPSPAVTRRLLSVAVLLMTARALSGVEVVQAHFGGFVEDRLVSGDASARGKVHAAGAAFATVRVLAAAAVTFSGSLDRRGRYAPIVVGAFASAGFLLFFCVAVVLFLGSQTRRGSATEFVLVLAAAAGYVVTAELGVFPGAFVVASEVLDHARRVPGLALAVAADAALSLALDALARPLTVLGWAPWFGLLSALAVSAAGLLACYLPPGTHRKPLEDVVDHVENVLEHRSDYLDALSDDISDSLETAAYQAFDSLFPSSSRRGDKSRRDGHDDDDDDDACAPLLCVRSSPA